MYRRDIIVLLFTLCHFLQFSYSDQKSYRPSALINTNLDFQKLGIGGLDKEFLSIFRRAFASRVFPPEFVEQFAMKHIRGILLYGPPGTGKTLIARQIGKLLNSRKPKIVNGPEIMDKYIGESEANMRRLFEDGEEEWRQRGPDSGLHIIIFDEIDAICKQRGSRESDRVVNQLLTKMDGVDQLNNILVIGMTNRKNLIDEALLRPGRFEIQLEISLPDEHGRLQILNIHTARMREFNRLDSDVDFETIARRTMNFSGAELEGLIRAAQSSAMNRLIKPGDNIQLDADAMDKLKVTADDFEYALENDVKPDDVKRQLDELREITKRTWKEFAQQLADQRNVEVELILGQFNAVRQKIGAMEQKEEEERKQLTEEIQIWKEKEEKRTKEMEKIKKKMQEMEEGRKEKEAEGKRKDKAWKRMLDEIGAKDDVWTLEDGVIYRWRECWKLIRDGNYMYIWCSANVLELFSDSDGYLTFLINDRLGILFSDGSTGYPNDNAENRAEFIGELDKAKAAVLLGTQPKPILSIPRTSQKIRFGNWDLSSVEDGTMQVTNRECPYTQHKLTITEAGTVMVTNREDTQQLVIKKDFMFFASYMINIDSFLSFNFSANLLLSKIYFYAFFNILRKQNFHQNRRLICKTNCKNNYYTSF